MEVPVAQPKTRFLIAALRIHRSQPTRAIGYNNLTPQVSQISKRNTGLGDSCTDLQSELIQLPGYVKRCTTSNAYPWIVIGVFKYRKARTTCDKSLEEIMKSLGIVGVMRLPECDPRDPTYAWLETLQEMAADRCRWLSCSDGEVLSWGANRRGQLGAPGDTSVSDVVRFTFNRLYGKPVCCSAGAQHSVVATDKGYVLVFGDLRYFHGPQAVDEPRAAGESRFLSFSRHLFGDRPVVQVASGWSHIVGRTDTGAVYTWGRADLGQLGRPNYPSIDSVGPRHDPTPGLVVFDDGENGRPVKIVDVAAGSEHSMALDENGRIWTWGWNEHGMCGILSVTDSDESGDHPLHGCLQRPTCVTFPSSNTYQSLRDPKAIAIGAGYGHSLAFYLCLARRAALNGGKLKSIAFSSFFIQTAGITFGGVDCQLSALDLRLVLSLSFHFLHKAWLHGSGARWLKWLEREFTDRKVRGSNPISASRLPLSRFGQPGNISALVHPSGGMAARHRKGVTAERFFFTAMRGRCCFHHRFLTYFPWLKSDSNLLLKLWYWEEIQLSNVEQNRREMEKAFVTGKSRALYQLIR
ncbi:Secretion-regulating guanine nucleotide exchange factor [Clonorchis sinensis]|uniref:Secretion-regulating guanine nucleotide exchange factor n=1 Tax=Clonorchis sinensis TaxID=79923 RepID=A0A3R7F4Q2_CLOSI|nr:Secretion-regulating guanine nucleotide exchange factor [Clonorchis sinensis]